VGVVWWISGVLVVGSLALLVLAIAAVWRRLGRLNLVMRRLRLRVADVERSTLPKITALQEGAARLQEKVLVAQERAERLQARRAGATDS
jgi:hypothetical protein